MKNKIPKNPYPGLRPFEFAENHLFFGREGQSEEVLRRLRESHFVAVVGTSGSGKSSLVRAGLLPLLYGGFMAEAGSRWRVALFRPGDNPIHNLSTALVHPSNFSVSSASKSQNPNEDEILKLAVTETVLRRSAVGLRDYANSKEFAAEENLLVVVDQFEELFRFKKENQTQNGAVKSETQEKAENEAAAFVKLLLEATNDKTNRVYVVITMRSDFLGDCSQFRDLPETINNGQYLIPRLTTEQLRKAIESPAKVKGARIMPALVARLLNDIGDDQDQLPVLQHALMRTWDEWAKEANPKSEINFDHYNATGGMATALSIHADEAFFELGDKDSEVLSRKQKIAEKLFKCLTETDRENRETRRATSLGKICAIADAGFDEVVSVIEVFRQPGRTFLMPPHPEMLDANTLIDISHESLIRKWDRLKKWVEEEAQAAQTYRRLAEDALLHKEGDKGFWGDPELTKTLKWKEDFKPNETWAQLYKEKGERTIRAPFDETIQYLENSKIDRNKKQAKEKLQRILLATLSVLFFITTIVAGFMAYKARESAAEAEKQKAVAITERAEAVKQGKVAEEQKEEAKKQEEVAVRETRKTLEQKDIAEKQKEIAQRQTRLAKEQTQKAKLSEDETQIALKEQEHLKDEATKARDEAIDAQKTAEKAQKESQALANREVLNRTALTHLEQGENELALSGFKTLLRSYRRDNSVSSGTRKIGLWWTLHNLGIVYSRLQNFKEAEKSYKDALTIMDEPQDDNESLNTQPQSIGKYFLQTISYQSDHAIKRSKATTLRRLAQLYREQARRESNDENSRNLNLQAIKRYNRLLEILTIEYGNAKRPSYLTDVYVELADSFSDLNDLDNYNKAKELYKRAIEIYKQQKDFVKSVAILKKWSDVALNRQFPAESAGLLSDAIKFQENEMDLSPLSLELADSYNRFAKTMFYVMKLGNEYPEQLSELIDKLDFAVNKSNSFFPNVFEPLANLYLNHGNCRRAEKVYLYAIGKTNQVKEPIRLYYETYILIETGKFYQNIKRNEKAQIYFDMAFEKIKNLPEDYISNSITDYNLFITLADFYFDKGDLERASSIYDKTGKIIDYWRRDDKQTGDKEKTKDYVLKEAEVTLKIARLYEMQKYKESEIEAKYKEALNLVDSEYNESNNNSITISVYLADFYQRTGKTREANEIYSKVRLDYQKTSNSLGRISMLVYLQKKFGDVSKNNSKIAAYHYEQAITILNFYDKEFPYKNGEYLQRQYGEYNRYYKNEELTAKFFEDKAEIYEAWANLNGVENHSELKQKAEEASQTAQKIKLQEEQSQCKENIK